MPLYQHCLKVGHWVMKIGHDILLTLNVLHAKYELYPSINNKDMALLHINELLIATIISFCNQPITCNLHRSEVLVHMQGCAKH